jgi:predicted nucleotidyltransferase
MRVSNQSLTRRVSTWTSSPKCRPRRTRPSDNGLRCMPSLPELLPGTARHQALLRSIVEAYEHDARVLAIGVLGSIARGTWDEWSDLDLDIVTTGELDAVAEGRRLGGPDALVLPTRPGEVDVVLPSLEEFSIRYHPLGTTNAHIVDDLKIISGNLDRDQIVAAGLRVSRPPRSLELIVSEALRLAIGVHIRLRRRHVWQAVWLLDDLRARLMELFATARGVLPVREFDALATPELKGRMGTLLARDDLQGVERALISALDLLEHDLPSLSNAAYELTPQQRGVLSGLRRRMADSQSLTI